MDDIFSYKKPKLSKFQKNYDMANRRICNTYDKIGAFHRMKDKIGQRFETILVKQLKGTSDVEFYPLTEEEAYQFNKDIYG